ncbi:hypothetical protein BT96DRAFT_308515 [Gymnopus androsaceus JB14]|uniref:Uncharacterized protein n=1 Tax=Gymnopus androsaceus JB14 TaxID=1447944 RepID=A0A6A4H1D9_9AGAR|nr:hypothetical protein BT96DRAFT_308515 [Gymnopus androsaceus JB14]
MAYVIRFYLFYVFAWSLPNSECFVVSFLFPSFNIEAWNHCICVLAFLHIPFFLAFSSDQLRQCPLCQAFSLARRPLIYRFLFELHYGYTRLNDQEYNLDDFLSSESSPLTRVH